MAEGRGTTFPQDLTTSVVATVWIGHSAGAPPPIPGPTSAATPAGQPLRGRRRRRRRRGGPPPEDDDAAEDSEQPESEVLTNDPVVSLSAATSPPSRRATRHDPWSPLPPRPREPPGLRRAPQLPGGSVPGHLRGADPDGDHPAPARHRLPRVGTREWAQRRRCGGGAERHLHRQPGGMTPRTFVPTTSGQGRCKYGRSRSKTT